MTCTHCGADLAREPGVGLVDSLSGDDGGTYDRCPKGGRHEVGGNAPAIGERTRAEHVL